MRSLFTCAIFGLFLSVSAQALPRKDEDGLAEDYAKFRSSLIRNVHYKIAIEADEKSDTFRGDVVVEFDLSAASEDLTLDFRKGKVEVFEINGARQKEFSYQGNFLALPSQALKAGRNAVRVNYSHPYSDNGSGFYRFKDPEDGRVYTYTDFEPYNANLFIPCFDQPDLKASYELQAEVPSSWTVVSTRSEKMIRKNNEGTSRWYFPDTGFKLSTYLFSLHAGPYEMWKDRDAKIPSRLFARRSIAKYVDSKEWFDITRRGLDFFGSYFDVPYPFKKYDQIMVPDYNHGAMENVGAVTFSERFAPRGAVTRDDRRARASTILHEMAHMWFGDLVTMRWWNDLWLNESFATYMADLALDEATSFKEAWLGFYSGEKRWAYHEDQLPTTHPIEMPAPDTDTAFAIFDGITYGKGASVLKQISFLIGEEHFREGVRSYFKQHAYGNATLADFVSALASASKKDLSRWTNDWLRKPSLNTVEVSYRCDGGKLGEVTLLQRAPAAHPTFREHRTRLALLSQKNGKLVVTKTFDVTYDGEKTLVDKLKNEPCPSLVFANFDDYDYVVTAITDDAAAVLRSQIGTLEDDLLRTMLWDSLWNSVRAGALRLDAYTEIVFGNLSNETNTTTLRNVLATLTSGRQADGSALEYFPVHGNRNQMVRMKFIERVEEFVWSQMLTSQARSDRQLILFDSYIRFAQSKAGLARLTNLLLGKEKVAGVKIDQDRRWTMLRQLASFEAENARSLIEKEKRLDNSDTGKKSAISAEVVQPNEANKRAWFHKAVDEKSGLPLATRRVIMSALFPLGQEEFRKQFSSEYFKLLPRYIESRDVEFYGTFAATLVPAVCEADALQKLVEFSAAHSSFPLSVRNDIAESIDEDKKCLAVRTRLEAP